MGKCSSSRIDIIVMEAIYGQIGLRQRVRPFWLLLADLASPVEFPSKNDISSLFSLNKYRRKADRIFSRREAKMAASFLFYYHCTFCSEIFIHFSVWPISIQMAGATGATMRSIKLWALNKSICRSRFVDRRPLAAVTLPMQMNVREAIKWTGAEQVQISRRLINWSQDRHILSTYLALT